ncbi:hypothetical protein BDZ89DRAFT_1148154 [Hymenopellis radicata]|nr:hypothetical protein BDZ89DRAFT_1148154 [Hymenopellis radicata]
MSILRFVDPTEGRILIDGIDISKIGVHDLRERLARPFAKSAVLKLIIALDSHSARRMSGTHRENLDTFNELDDNECWEALYRVQIFTQSQILSEATTAATSRPASIDV